jgi:hypothetical protein
MVLGSLFHIASGWHELAGDFMHVAPGPSFSRHNRTHYWMLRFVKMPCGVFAG